MSTQVSTAFVQQWTDGIRVTAQQKMSRLRNAVMVESGIQGDRAFFDQVGSVTATVASTRHADTPITDTPHTRRMLTLSPYKHADLIDVSDKIRILNDPTSSYQRAFSAAFGRAIDSEIITAATGAASTGVAGATSTAHGAGQQIAAGGADLTLIKLITAKRLLDAAEVGEPNEERYIAVTSNQVEALLNDSTLTSADYNTVRALVSGEIDTFVGFKFIRTELLAVASSIRTCIAWTKSAIVLGIGQDVTGRIEERADKNYSTQVFMSMDIGATRLEEVGVVDIQCDET
jgi:hypothetical protein